MSDSDKDASDGDFEEFDDGLDENLIGGDEDKKRLEQMTEKERCLLYTSPSPRD